MEHVVYDIENHKVNNENEMNQVQRLFLIWSQELLWSFVHGNYEASDISQTINSPGGKKLKLLYQYPVEIKQVKVFALPKNISLSETTLLLE